MDAVSARDHMQEMVSHCAITASHLSRLAAGIILWSSKEFSRVRLSDDFSTGSSIMPQKEKSLMQLSLSVARRHEFTAVCIIYSPSRKVCLWRTIAICKKTVTLCLIR